MTIPGRLSDTELEMSPFILPANLIAGEWPCDG
jgi:hypothetical protein